jgi:hypothetical protein
MTQGGVIALTNACSLLREACIQAGLSNPEELTAMQKWKYTSYENGQAVTHSDLSWSEAVRALERAMVGRTPFEEDEEREPGTAEHRIAA